MPPGSTSSGCSRARARPWSLRSDPATARRDSGIAAIVRGLGHADLRWHLWIVLAAFGRLDLALIAYAVYFPARHRCGSDPEGVAPCVSPGLPYSWSPAMRLDNLAECLAAARWADERVVVVDAASRDATLEIARRDADRVAVRVFDDFASQRNAALAMSSGDWVLSVDADERITPRLAAEIRRVVAEPLSPFRGYRVPIRSEILGRPFGFSGTQHDNPLRLFRATRADGRGSSTRRWTCADRPASSGASCGTGRYPHGRVPRQDQPVHHARGRGARRASAAVPDRGPRGAAGLDLPQALSVQAGIPRRRRGLRVLLLLGHLGRGAGTGSTAS